MRLLNDSKALRIAMVTGSLLALILILIVSYGRTDHEREFLEHLAFQGEIEGQCMELKLWKDELQDCYYLFLPSCFNRENVRLTVCYDGSMGKISINNVPFWNGAVLDNINDERIYQIQFSGPLGVIYADKSMQVLISENLPAVMITAEAEELKKFKIRGNLTATLDKKPYKIHLTDL